MDYIIESILNYVKKPNTNYAVMLNGSWGSGKTYFWNHVLSEKIENLETEEDKKISTIYVSLYGIKNLDEIAKQIFFESYVLKNKKVKEIAESHVGKRITQFGKAAISIAKNFDIPIVDKLLETNIQIDFGNLTNLKNCVICFDDLERANIDITDVLGYINNFVEQDNIKVIIISNEKEISEKLNNRNLELKTLTTIFASQKVGNLVADSKVKDIDEIKRALDSNLGVIFNKSDDYKRIKEKLIGKTLTYSMNDTELISALVDEITNEEYKNYLYEQLEFVISTFTKSETKNIRILKQGLDDFETVYKIVLEKYPDFPKPILKLMLIFTLAASFEIKTDVSGNDELEKLNLFSDYQATLISFKMLNKDKSHYLELFKKKYFSAFSDLDYIFFKFIEVLIRKGILDREIFDRELDEVINNLTKKIPLHIRLLRHGYWELTDEEYAEALQECYTLIHGGELHLPFYLDAFRVFSRLSEIGLLEEDTTTIKEHILKGLDLAFEKQQYYRHLDVTLLPQEEADNQDIKEIKDKIKSLNKGFFEKKTQKEMVDLIELIPDEINKFYYLLQEKYFYIPIFAHCDVDSLYDKVVGLENGQIINFANILKKRYLGSSTQQLSTELKTFELLSGKILEHIKDKDLSLRIALFKELIKVLKNISEILVEDHQEEVEVE
ncbi:P-loop NTPase fold protein [Bacillus sp. FJAT-29937]|uniref:P-loop NTPase fold protein n=1 Tax=Bacillus sp. FJAT-29937 TaxID=1720553 RepID=UPI00083423C4|nr:P-loop NTPase fold protein [Bacillus sp. FJAT-29937]